MRLAKRFALLTTVSLFAAVVAYVQSRLLVQIYGAGKVLDAYYLATAAPMAAMTMLGNSGTALLVPLFAVHRNEDGRVDDSTGLRIWAVAVVVVSLLIAGVVSLAIGMWPSGAGAAGWLALIALGSGAYGLSFYAQALLVAEERPVWFAWAQVVSFVGFIALLIALPWPKTVQTVSLLYFVGGALQLLVSVIAVASRRRTSGHIHSVGVTDFRSHVGRAVFSAIWVVVFMQCDNVLDRWYSSRYAVGFVTSYALADKMVQILVSTLAVTVGTIVFPRLLEKGRSGGLLTGASIVAVTLALAPVSAVLVAFPKALVALAYGGGQFKASAVNATSGVLALLSLGLLPMGLVYTLPRRLQAVGRYRVQAVIAGALLASDIVLKLVLTATIGVTGVALSSSLAFVVGAVLYLAYLVRARLLHFSGEHALALVVTLVVSAGVTIGARQLFGAEARWWVPALCLALSWGLIAALLGKRLGAMGAGPGTEVAE